MRDLYDTEDEVGQDNSRTWGIGLHNLVFIVSSILDGLLLNWSRFWVR